MKLIKISLVTSFSVFSQLTLFTLPTTAKQSISDKKSNFKCDHLKFEKTINRFFFMGDPNFVYPVKLAEQNANCKKLKEVERYSKDYVEKCLRRETRNIFKIILYGNSRVHRNYCLNDARKATFVSIGACLNRHKAKIVTLNDALNRDLHAVAAMPEKKLKIPILCCNYFVFKARMMAILDDCTPTERDTFEVFLDAITTDGFSLMCNVQENSDECKQLLKQMPKWTKPLKRKVAVLAGIDVLDSL